jgi:hypothetical protein
VGIISDPSVVRRVTIHIEVGQPLLARVEQFTEDGQVEAIIRALRPVAQDATPPEG